MTSPKDIIQLSPTEAQRFENSLRKRAAIAEAGEAMARTFSQQMQEAIAEINDAYVNIAQLYGLDLEKQRYEYDPTRKVLVLTMIALHGKVG